MKKNVLFLTGIAVIVLFAFRLHRSKPMEDKDYSECVVKVNSKWGDPCDKCENFVGNKRDFSETYTVYLKNECTEAVDVKCCVQEKDKIVGWRCFTRNNLAPNDTLVAYACKSTKGKYLKWVRKAGDNEIILPTDEEVKKEFKE